jgi:Clostripain family
MITKNSTILLLTLVFLLQFSAAYSETTQEYEWVFIYYISYDNNLDSYGKTVLDELSKGVIDSNIAVVIQADFLDQNGMRRIGLSHRDNQVERKEYLLESENSADENEYNKYLEWVKNNWKAKNYAIIILDHGGLLNQMCFDENPFKDKGRNIEFAPSGKWFNSLKIGEICRQFHQTTEEKVKLLFLQQCGRASLENLYNFVDSADYIMASPVNVGSPNTYYTQMLEYTAKHTNISGADLAQIIMKEDQHYSIYTLINNNELQQLPYQIQQVFDAYIEEKKLTFTNLLKKVFRFGDEMNFDLKSFLLTIRPGDNEALSQKIDTFIDWFEQKLIVMKQDKIGNNSQFSGLSIYFPGGKEHIQRYSFLPFYQQTHIEKIFQIIFGQD